MFIKLHYIDDSSELTVNTKYITVLKPYRGGTSVCTVDGYCYVAESYDEVNRMVRVDKEGGETGNDYSN